MTHSKKGPDKSNISADSNLDGTALDHESGDRLGTFDEILLENKSHATVHLRQIDIFHILSLLL